MPGGRGKLRFAKTNSRGAAALKVLILTQYFWPESFLINQVATSLKDAGADVTILTGKPNYPEGRFFAGYRGWGTQQESFKGIPVYRVPMTPRGRRGSAPALVLNYISFAISASVFGPWLLRHKHIDVVFVFGISPILQAIPGILFRLFKRAALVLWIQDLWPQSLEATGFVRNRLLLKLVEWIVRAIYRFSDVLLVQSHAFIDEVAKLTSRDKVVYHPNPADADLARSQLISDCPIQLADAFNVVFAGNLGSAQALHVIVDAAERLKGHDSIRFVLVGSGSRSEWMKEQIACRRLTNIDMPGRFPSHAMPGVLGRASVLLITLACNRILRLTVPSKVQAYLAAGKPIIAALDGEGARIVAEARAGICVPSENADALALAVLRLASLPKAELDAMGACGRTYYEQHFTPELLTRRLLSIFERSAAQEGT